MRFFFIELQMVSSSTDKYLSVKLDASVKSEFRNNG